MRKHVKTVAELGREQEYYDYNTVKGNWTLFTFVILGWTKIVGIETGIVARY